MRRWPALFLVLPLAACGGDDSSQKAPASTTAKSAAPSPAPACGGNQSYGQTQLFLGRSIPGGGTVSEADFATFLDLEVTPRFPAGFTVIAAQGQYRDAGGTIAREVSDILVLLYPKAEAAVANSKLEVIRDNYKKTFHQESVLREDEQPACVRF